MAKEHSEIPITTTQARFAGVCCDFLRRRKAASAANIDKKKPKSLYHSYIDFGDRVGRKEGEAHFVPATKMANLTVLGRSRGIQTLFSFIVTGECVKGRLMSCSCSQCASHNFSACTQKHIVGAMTIVKLKVTKSTTTTSAPHLEPAVDGDCTAPPGASAGMIGEVVAETSGSRGEEEDE